ncbi:unnamed protein product, partial [Didymodactylos carnosus]
GDVHNSDDEEDNQQSITVLNDGQVNDDDEGEEDNSESEMAGGDEDDELTKDKSEKITKVAAIAKFSHKSSIFADRLENIKLSIPTANETRWNSQFYTLKAVYNIPHSELNMILNDLKKPELILSSTDKTVLTGFIQLLELFEEATMDAQSENHATISCVAPCILSVVHSLNSKKCDHLENMRVSLLLSMKARFSGLLRQFAIDVPNDRYVMAERFADPIFLLTPTLDVRFKLHWLNDIVDSQDTRRDIGKETLTDTNKEQQTSDAAYSPACGKRKLSKLFPYLENPSKRILNIKSTVSEELENFETVNITAAQHNNFDEFQRTKSACLATFSNEITLPDHTLLTKHDVQPSDVNQLKRALFHVGDNMKKLNELCNYDAKQDQKLTAVSFECVLKNA